MTVQVKSGGSYADVAGVFVKHGGAYSAADVYAKVAGVYANVLSQAVPIQSETTALLARMTTQPSETEKSVINRLIYDLKQANIWDRLDGLWVPVIHNAQAAFLNWVSTSYNLTQPSGGTFSAYGGWKGDGVSQYLSTGFNPATASSPKFTQNDASFGLLIFPEAGILVGNIYGSFNGTQGCQLSPFGTGNEFRFRVNQTAATILTGVNDGSGFFVANRSASNSTQAYRNGTLIASGTEASIPVVSQVFDIGRISASFYGSPPCPIGLAFVGASLSSAQQTALNESVSRYMDGMAVAFSISVNVATTDQTFMGGYVEIQPDSFNGGSTIPATDGTTDKWGFPYTLSTSERARLKSLLFPGGGKGLHYLRLPIGFAYRGLRNIDPASGLAKNVGERYAGINDSLSDMIANVTASGGGLAPEYWGVPPHWTTQGKFGGSSGNVNTLWAGGSYPRTTSLESIRVSDPTQYAAQINAITNAMLDDFEYLHTNVGPIRMYGMQNEPQFGEMQYGSCRYSDTLYKDVLASLQPKVAASSVLSTWGGQPNTPKLHVASDDTFNIGQGYISAFPSTIWGYTHHNIQAIANNADWVKTSVPILRGAKSSLWINETEYFTPTANSDQWKCANNMLRDMHNLVYGSAPVSMPIIHVAKQIGATTATSNTKGYALVEVNLDAAYGQAPGSEGNPSPSLDYQSFRPVAHNYNAHALLAENLPVGAVRVGGAPAGLPAGVGFAAFTFGGKLYVFIANRNAYSVRVSVTFAASKTFNGKRYNVNELGASAGSLTGSVVAFTCAAYSGTSWIEV